MLQTLFIPFFESLSKASGKAKWMRKGFDPCRRSSPVGSIDFRPFVRIHDEFLRLFVDAPGASPIRFVLLRIICPVGPEMRKLHTNVFLVEQTVPQTFVHRHLGLKDTDRRVATLLSRRFFILQSEDRFLRNRDCEFVRHDFRISPNISRRSDKEFDCSPMYSRLDHLLAKYFVPQREI